MACIHNITCSNLDILTEPALSLVKTVCSQRLSCDDKVYVIVNTSLVCLSECYVPGPSSEYLPWVRPVTCAAIAVSAILFFALLYFGKSWTESRGADRRMNRKQEQMAGREGPHWNRLKISVLTGNRCQDSPTPETPRLNATPRASELEMAMFDTKT